MLPDSKFELPHGMSEWPNIVIESFFLGFSKHWTYQVKFISHLKIFICSPLFGSMNHKIHVLLCFLSNHFAFITSSIVVGTKNILYQISDFTLKLTSLEQHKTFKDYSFFIAVFYPLRSVHSRLVLIYYYVFLFDRQHNRYPSAFLIIIYDCKWSMWFLDES